MLINELIIKKRDGNALSDIEIKHIITLYTKGELEDYQMSALLMAIYFKGMTDKETNALTQAMLNSGETIDFSYLKGKKIDKHSTGGVGDKVSLILAPIMASLNIYNPMIAGRGLGHTGGTLDKLEAIPGFNINLSMEEFKKNVAEIGASIIGQSKEIAPADKKLYALRDVTGTVASMPLITASIMSKKLAEGIDGLVMDIKVGDGAFMKNKMDARKLAKSIINTGKLAKKNVVVMLTDMEQALGLKIGNWLEIEECLDSLQGRGPADLLEITHGLAALMILLSGKEKDLKKAYDLSVKSISSGQAYLKFLEMAKAQGAELEYLKNPQNMKKATYKIEFFAPKNAYLKISSALKLGQLNVLIGGGRLKISDRIDPIVGIEIFHKVGDKIKKGEKIASVFYNLEELKSEINDRLKNCFEFSSKIVRKRKLILEVLK
jgi:pyrimidine-nucleoside phosphorylase